MADQGKIPIGDARRISRERNHPLVVIFGLDATGERFTVTTYGATKKLCKLAASFGEQFAAAVMNGKVSPPQFEPDGIEQPATFDGRRGDTRVS